MAFETAKELVLLQDLSVEELEVVHNELLLAGRKWMALHVSYLIFNKGEANGTDIAVDGQPLRTDVDGSQAR